MRSTITSIVPVVLINNERTKNDSASLSSEGFRFDCECHFYYVIWSWEIGFDKQAVVLVFKQFFLKMMTTSTITANTTLLLFFFWKCSVIIHFIFVQIHFVQVYLRINTFYRRKLCCLRGNKAKVSGKSPFRNHITITQYATVQMNDEVFHTFGEIVGKNLQWKHRLYGAESLSSIKLPGGEKESGTGSQKHERHKEILGEKPQLEKLFLSFTPTCG